MKNKTPHNFRVDQDSSLDIGYTIFQELDSDHPCFNCVVRDCRAPEYCDDCPVNPDRERLIRSGLLNKKN